MDIIAGVFFIGYCLMLRCLKKNFEGFVNKDCVEWNGICKTVLIDVPSAIYIGLAFGIIQSITSFVSGVALLYEFTNTYVKLSMFSILLLLLMLLWTGVVMGGGTFSAYKWGFGIYLPCHLPIVLIMILKVLYLNCGNFESWTIT